MAITYSRDIFIQLKEIEDNNVLSDNIKHIISTLVIKPSFIDSSVFRKKYKTKGKNKTNKVYFKNNGWRKNKPIIGKPVKNDFDKIAREINSLLNKISKNNFDIILEQILNNLKDFSDEKIVNLTINNIFEKSIIQPNYCPFYVKICIQLIDKNSKCRELIKNKCGDYFEMITYNNESLINENSKDVKINENINEKQRCYDEFCILIKKKTKKKGFSQFIGELYLNRIIELLDIDKVSNILVNNINNILQGNDIDMLESNIICLCELFNTIFEDIKKVTNIRSYINNIKSFSKNPKVIKRLQFSLMDLLDKIE